tara:strand:+ start:1945 stop:4035 length:2091 start_codon:yes stop_codon:yes gene_type:complete
MGIRSQNNPIAAYLDVFSNTGTDAVSAAPIPVSSGLIASGGVISDYVTTPGDVYRAHIFTSTGELLVTGLGGYGTTVEYLVVAGGGGGGLGSDFTSYQSGGGGGGAGGLLVSPGFPGVPTSQNQGTTMAVSAGPTSYTIQVGGGGVYAYSGPSAGPTKGGGKGGDSVISGPDITTITSKGGGGGAGAPVVAAGGSGYGSGGGGQAYGPAPVRPGGAGGSYPGPTQQGFPGGIGGNAGGVRLGGGGGGAGAAGIPGSDPEPGITEGDGGLGLQVLIAGNASAAAIGTPGPSGTGWVAQGGHSGAYNNGSNGIAPQPAGGGGGDGGAHTYVGGNGLSGTGGGGGGANAPGPAVGVAGGGGSGIVVVRYKIAEITATAKATGGAISFYGGKTIHAFTNSGSFENTSGSSLSIDYIVVGGGGGGSAIPSYLGSGGGGAGGVISNIPGLMPAVTPIPAVGSGSPNKLTITVGSGGVTPGITAPISGQGGTPSSMSGPGPVSVTGWGGGYGADMQMDAGPGGSGGGGAYSYPTSSQGTGSRQTGTSTAVSPLQGYDGGQGTPDSPKGAGGGGGGAGGAGVNATPSPIYGGEGGIGVQLPSAFHNPKSNPGSLGGGLGYPGPGSPGKYWVAGGGGGGAAGYTPDAPARGGAGAPGAPGPYAGAGDGGAGPGNTGGTNAKANSGSGGGNMAYGGSGLVLIAYPS